jgi:hypothetical protein
MFLNLPCIPQDLIDSIPDEMGPANRAASTTYSTVEEQMYATRSLRLDGSTARHVRNVRYILPDPFQEWIYQNIAQNALECTITIGDAYCGHIGPHTDRARNFALLYVLEAGGSRVLNSFWQQKNHPVLRPRATLVDDYDQLVLLAQCHYGCRQWVIMDSRILHSVENISTSRVAIQIAFDDLSEIESKTGAIGFL